MNQFERFFALIIDLLATLAGFIPRLWRTGGFYVRWVVGMTLASWLYLTAERLTGGWSTLIPTIILLVVVGLGVLLSYQLPAAPAAAPPAPVVPAWHNGLWLATQIAFVAILVGAQVWIGLAFAPNVASAMFSLLFVVALLGAVIMGYIDPLIIGLFALEDDLRKVMGGIGVLVSAQLIYGLYLWFFPIENWPVLLAPLLLISITIPLLGSLKYTAAKTAAGILMLGWIGISATFFFPLPVRDIQRSIPVAGAAMSNQIRKIGASPDHKVISIVTQGEGVPSRQMFVIGGPQSDIPPQWWYEWEGSCDVRAHFIDFGQAVRGPEDHLKGFPLDENVPGGLRGRVVFTGPENEIVEIHLSKEKPTQDPHRGRCPAAPPA